MALNDGGKIHCDQHWEVMVEGVVGLKYMTCTANEDIVESTGRFEILNKWLVFMFKISIYQHHEG